MTITALPTWYDGIKFRSRLEARWAVMFDLMGIVWEYETGGYAFNGRLPYLPDFQLPEYNCFIEIKPDRLYKCKVDDKEYSRLIDIDSAWNDPESTLPPLYIIAGVPMKAQTWVDGEWCMVLPCRRCGALSFSNFEQHGDIGTHPDCGCEKESFMNGAYRSNALIAGGYKFDHR